MKFLGSSLFSVGERFREARQDTSGTSMILEWLLLWRMLCPTPSGLLKTASEPLV
jgi:hypothetical protein